MFCTCKNSKCEYFHVNLYAVDYNDWNECCELSIGLFEQEIEVESWGENTWEWKKELKNGWRNF